MGLFDLPEIPVVTLEAEMGPYNSFHISRPLVKSSPPTLPHKHEFYEVFWIATGCCLHFINNQRVDLSAGELVFIRPDDVHAFQNREKTPCRMINVAFSSQTADHLLERYGAEFAGRYFWSNAEMPVSVSLNQQGLDELARLEAALDQGARSLARIEGFLLNLTTGLLPTENNVPSATPQWLARACEGMRDPDALREGVPLLIERTGRSHEHVSRTFKRVFGQTPSSWVNGLRMELAARMLVSEDWQIPEVALACGIEDLSHFYRLFRQTYGVSPMKYRKREKVDLVHPLRSQKRA